MRDWWLRTLLVLQRPRPVFVALRNDTRETAGEMSEPILLVTWLAGIASVLFAGGTMLDDSQGDGVDVAIQAFIGGGVTAAVDYFVLGALLQLAVRLFGSQGTYRRSRHVVAFASVPIALSLVLWPVKLSLYGLDWFRSGGSDTGSAGIAFDLLTYAFFAWAIVLLAIGVRSVHGWPWRRALPATFVGLLLPAILTAFLVGR